MIANETYTKHANQCPECGSVDRIEGGHRCSEGQALVRAAEQERKATGANIETPKDFTFKYDQRRQDPISRLLEGEPWFFFRAQDSLSIDALHAYAEALKKTGDELRSTNPDKADNLFKQALGVLNVCNRFADWQTDNADFVKLPD